MCVQQMAPKARPSSDMAAFRKHFEKAKHIVVLSGAGVSAESGVPTFRGAGGFWRTYQAQVCFLSFKHYVLCHNLFLFLANFNSVHNFRV